MPGVSSRRVARLVLLLVLIFATSACTSRRFGHYRMLHLFPDPDPSPCHADPGKPVPDPTSPELPIVCIDDRDMTVPIRPLEVTAKRNAVIKWFTVTGKGSLSIVFEDPSPVRHLVCGENKAFCQAVIDPNAVATKYTYSMLVWSDKKKQTIDPTVQVDPGVVVWDAEYKP